MIARPTTPWVFAVEDRSVQLTWPALGTGDLTVDLDGRSWTVPLDGRGGCLDLDDLEPDRGHRARWRVRGDHPAEGELRFRTLAPPPGPELCRIGTVTDLHLARRTFGLRRIFTDDPALEPHSVRCARAALDDLVGWGAGSLVVKGDLVESSLADHWDHAAKVLAGVGLPVDLVAGNHELNRSSRTDAFVEATARGLRIHRGMAVVDHPGLRVVLVDSAVPVLHSGRWGHRAAELAEAAREAAGPALVVSHHQPQRWPVHTYFPPGVPWGEARETLHQLRHANPAVLGTSGHTHRHRFHRIAGVPWAETGSTKDYPGTWAGYVVHEGGIRQVVRRVPDPDCLTWLDRTADAAMGAWGRWSPGRLRDRCFTWRWPAR